MILYNPEIALTSNSLSFTASYDDPAFDKDEDMNESTMSHASTVNIDNTSSYLMRCADKYAHEQSNNGVGTTFIKVNKFKEGQEVQYANSFSVQDATVVGVHHYGSTTYYTITLKNRGVQILVDDSQLCHSVQTAGQKENLQKCESTERPLFTENPDIKSDVAVADLIFPSKILEAKGNIVADFTSGISELYPSALNFSSKSITDANTSKSFSKHVEKTSNGTSNSISYFIDEALLNSNTTTAAASTTSITKFQDIKTPTVLFIYIYSGQWEEALKRVESHPDEASAWVVRYAKNHSEMTADDSSTGGVLRWKLLPLHLLISFLIGNSCGRMNEDSDLPVPSFTNSVPLLKALLMAYPQATQSADDQNMIPLHACIRGHSPLNIIQELLHINPKSVFCKDVKGRNAFTLADRVFQKYMTQAVVEKNMKCEMSHGLKIKEWKRALNQLLVDAARHASSPRNQMQIKEVHAQLQNRVQKLQNDNLILRQENAWLRYRAMRNEENLRQIRQAFQSLQQIHASALKQYKETFAKNDEIHNCKGKTAISIPECKASEITNSNILERVADEEPDICSTPKKPIMLESMITPSSTMTTSTEFSSPSASPERPSRANNATSDQEITLTLIDCKHTEECHAIDWETRCRVLELESYDDDEKRGQCNFFVEEKNLEEKSNSGKNEVSIDFLSEEYNSIFRNRDTRSTENNSKEFDFSTSSNHKCQVDGVDKSADVESMLSYLTSTHPDESSTSSDHIRLSKNDTDHNNTALEGSQNLSGMSPTSYQGEHHPLLANEIVKGESIVSIVPHLFDKESISEGAMNVEVHQKYDSYDESHITSMEHDLVASSIKDASITCHDIKDDAPSDEDFSADMHVRLQSALMQACERRNSSGQANYTDCLTLITDDTVNDNDQLYKHVFTADEQSHNVFSEKEQEKQETNEGSRYVECPGDDGPESSVISSFEVDNLKGYQVFDELALEILDTTEENMVKCIEIDDFSLQKNAFPHNNVIDANIAWKKISLRQSHSQGSLIKGLRWSCH